MEGGDTPTQETLFAIEFEAGKFAFGHANEDEIFVATKDGLAQILYADADGVITDYTPTADNVASAIIDAYNEHFGTDINIWTPETKSLQLGDTVPNWNAYEKILLPAKEYFRFNASGSSAYLTGFVQGENAFLNTNSNNSVWGVNPEGSVLGAGGPISTFSAQAKRLLLNEYGKEFDVINAFVENWKQGQTVPNWESYTLIS